MIKVVPNPVPSCLPTLSQEEEEKKSLAFIKQNFEKLTGYSNTTAYNQSEETLLSKSRPGSITVEKAKDEDSPLFSLFQKLATFIVYILEKILSDPRIKRMPGDGDCLLHSLIYSLKLKTNSQNLRKEIIPHIDTADRAFKDEIYEFFSSASFRSRVEKEKVLRSLMNNITNEVGAEDIPEIERCQKAYLNKMSKNGFFLGGSAIKAVQKLYGGQVVVVDRNFQTITRFCDEYSSEKPVTLRLDRQHYDVVTR